MADDVFISYRRADERWARQLHARLAAQGIHAWYDVRIGAGQDWRTATASALESAKIFVLLFSTAASESEEVTKELAAATLQKKLIVPVRLEDIQPRGAFLYELAGRNWINAYENTEATLDELARNLAGMLRPASLEAASPSHFDRTTSQQTPAAARRKNTWAVTIAAGVVALVALAAGSWFLATRRGSVTALTPDKTAFFGFDVRGADAELETIATSATSEVFDTLGAMNITTAARAETLGAPPDERFVRAQRLGAVYALGGEVLREGPRTTIAIRLEDVATRSTLWSESVSGPASETVPLPVRAAALATDTLRCVSQVRAGLRKADMEVVRLLPRVCREVRVTRLASVAAFRDLLRAAPESPEAQAIFAIGTLIVINDAPRSAQPALLAEAEAAARRAMEIDPRQGDAWLARYWVATRQGASLLEREKILAAGLEVAPESASLNQYLAVLLQASGRYKDALPYGRLAVANDPLSGPKQIAFAELLAAAGLTSEAEVAIERAMTRAPSAALWQLRIRNAILQDVGNAQALLTTAPAVVTPAVVDCWREIFTAYRSADSRQRQRGVDAVKACSARGVLTLNVAPVLAALGDLDGAFALLNPLLDAPALSSPPNFSFLFWRSTMALRAEPRFLPLIKALGLATYWEATGTRPDLCATDSAPFCAALPGSR